MADKNAVTDYERWVNLIMRNNPENAVKTEIEELVRKWKQLHGSKHPWSEELIIDCAIYIAKETREKCAKVADRLSSRQTHITHPQQRMTVETTAASIATAIRNLEKE